MALEKLDYPLIGIDDANIYFVYARNLANGSGFVYNTGGERVEGFTSLLWTIISALAFKFSAHPELILLIINLILVSLGNVYALNYLQHLFSEGEEKQQIKVFWSALFLILIFISPRYIVWNTITLMENALWSTLLLLTTIFVIQEHVPLRTMNFGFISLSILLLLTRPESIVWVTVFTTIFFLRILSTTTSLSHTWKAIAPSTACILLTFVLLTIFRLRYFGYPFPNTYYAKVSPSFAYNLEQGALYLVRYFLSDPIAAMGVTSIALACIYSLLKLSPSDGVFYLPWIGATGLLIPLLTGGDHFGSFRFYQNVYPITILCLIYLIRQSLPRATRGLRYSRLPAWIQVFSFAGIALFVMYGFIRIETRTWLHFSPEIAVEFNVAKYERRNGAFIQDLFSSLPELPSIGVIASGGIKYSYRGEIIDLLGLNNTTMAHNHGDRMGYKNHAAFEVQTFYVLQPDIVWPVSVEESNWQYSETELKERWENTLGFKGLFNDPRFLEVYKYARVGRNSGKWDGLVLVAWFKKDLLANLLANEDFFVEEYEYSP